MNLSSANESDLIECPQYGYSSTQAVLRVIGNVPLILVGSLFNTLNMLVYSHRRMQQHHINWFLLALAAHDQLLLVSNWFMIPLPVMAEWLADADAVAVSNTLTRWTFPLGHYAHTVVVCLTATLSLYRYFGVCKPFRAQTTFTARRVKTSIATCFVFSATFTLPRWFELKTVACRYDAENRISATLEQTEIGAAESYTFIYTVVAYTAVVFVLPLALLTFTNVSIYFSLQTSQKLRRKMTQTSTPAAASLLLLSRCPSATPLAERKSGYRTFNRTNASTNYASQSSFNRNSYVSNRTHRPSSGRNRHSPNGRRQSLKTSEANVTRMLLVILSLFIVCNALSFIINCLERVVRRETFVVLVELSNILITLNSTANLPIYYVFCGRFRRRIAALGGRCCGLAERQRDGNMEGTYAQRRATSMGRQQERNLATER